MKTIIIIPARLESKRLNRKLLLPGPNGQPLLYFTWSHAQDSNADKVCIATDSIEIAHEASKFGAVVITTSPNHQCGTDRIAEAYTKLPDKADCIINLQGDEPEIRGKDIDLLIDQFQCWESSAEHAWMKIATLAVPFHDFHQYSMPQNVKVVFNETDNEAIYFSRGMIPWVHNLYEDIAEWLTKGSKPIAHKHLGVYAYTPLMLETFVNQAVSRLESIEGLEQMRAIENRWPILTVPVQAPDDPRNIWPLGINTNDDYKLWHKRTLATWRK